MTIESWQEEFCPPGSHLDAANADGDLPALTHALKKWEGMRPENLAKHAVRVGRGVLRELVGSGVMYPGLHCALCERYGDGCTDGDGVICPLASSTPESGCNGNTEDRPIWLDDCDDPEWDDSRTIWYRFAHTGDVEPMIACIKTALEKLK